MAGLRDYQQWHHSYDDPDSDLSWRLTVVQGYLADAFDRHRGAVRVLSLCSGDGRDVIGVLAGRDDADRVSATLVELHPQIAEGARLAAAAAGLAGVEVLTADAGTPASWATAVPAEVVLLVGIFGNIGEADLERTIRAAPGLCAPGATLVWSRGRQRDDLDARVRGWFAEVGFTELDHATRETGPRPALGCLRYDGPPVPLDVGGRLFTFVH